MAGKREKWPTIRLFLIPFYLTSHFSSFLQSLLRPTLHRDREESNQTACFLFFLPMNPIDSCQIDLSTAALSHVWLFNSHELKIKQD